MKEAEREDVVFAVWNALDPERHTQQAWAEGRFWEWYLDGEWRPYSCVHTSTIGQAARVLTALSTGGYAVVRKGAG